MTDRYANLRRALAKPLIITALLKERDELADALEIERMRLAECGVAALANTRDSIADRITPDNPYYSASYVQVCAAVDREIALRAERDALVSRSPSYDALLIISQSVAAALERAGVEECDDPGDAIDLLAQSARAPDGLVDRIDSAIQRIVDNHAPRRIPAYPSDVELVLAEVKAWINGNWPPFWISDRRTDDEATAGRGG